MSQIVAGIYEIQQKIGSGGGGIVYLGRHLRLEKQVVLKADKRTLNTKPEILRREVDMLKELSHQYIPQVYDFVQENGITYTVMDYIEGRSFDKILEAGYRLPQPDVIRWACQLLQALDYLHSRPPHGILHGDIKPANIMLRPDGNICLIDYNIALALGENGAVKVGFSRGYASPEHYGTDYSSSETLAETKKTATRDIDRMTTVTMVQNASGISKSGSKAVMLDVRSDIYSLGATLYHLLSGRRPAPDAPDVVPLTSEMCSLAISEIIRKSMAPDPGQRYQTAGEMLDAFLTLHRRDKRAVRHRGRMRIAFGGLTVTLFAGASLTFIGLKQLQQIESAKALAEYSANALENGDIENAVDLALQAIPEKGNLFQGPVTAQAQDALTNAMGIYDLSEGFKAIGTFELPSAPFKMTFSPEGTFLAVTYAYQTAVYRMGDHQKIAELPMAESALADAVFADETRIVYAGKDGVTAFDLEESSVLWKKEGGRALAVSGDGTAVAAADPGKNVVRVYRIADGSLLAERSLEEKTLQSAYNDIFADPEGSVFDLNEDGSLLAVSFSDGGLRLLDLRDPSGDTVVYENSDYNRFTGEFCGEIFAFAAEGADGSTMGLVMGETDVYLDGYTSNQPLLLRADEGGIYLADGNLLVRIDPVTLQETELAFTDSANITGFAVEKEHVLVATDDNGFSFYDSGANRMSVQLCETNCDFVCLSGGYAAVGNRDEPSVRLLELKGHGDTTIFSYDPQDLHDEARICADGQSAMLFNYQGFRIYDRNGSLLAEEFLPDAERIYDQQFVREEGKSWLEVIWYDGTVRCYSGVDGELLSERTESPPEENLYEEFFTDRYRIASPLHGTPEVYLLETGKRIATLEEEAYLTYVTQIGEFLLTEYVGAAGDRYGLLLNRDFEVLASLPGLCDYVDGKFIFDYHAGELRQSPLYSLEELLKLSEKF